MGRRLPVLVRSRRIGRAKQQRTAQSGPVPRVGSYALHHQDHRESARLRVCLFNKLFPNNCLFIVSSDHATLGTEASGSRNRILPSFLAFCTAAS
jgi:hypothetical protein